VDRQVLVAGLRRRIIIFSTPSRHGKSLVTAAFLFFFASHGKVDAVVYILIPGRRGGVRTSTLYIYMIFHCVRVYTRAYAFNFVLEKDPKQINRIAGDTHTGRERVRKKESERRKVKKKKITLKLYLVLYLERVTHNCGPTSGRTLARWNEEKIRRKENYPLCPFFPEKLLIRRRSLWLYRL